MQPLFCLDGLLVFLLFSGMSINMFREQGFTVYIKVLMHSVVKIQGSLLCKTSAGFPGKV